MSAAKVLIVDDDDDAREILADALCAEGLETATARDGIDALEYLRTSARPSVILLDLMMPRLDGEGLVRAMKADATLAQIPIVFLSGHNAVHELARELGVAAWLTKPFGVEQVLEKMAELSTDPAPPLASL